MMAVTDALLAVIAVTLAVMAAQLIRVIGRVSKAADEGDALRADLRRLIRGAEEALADVRKIAGRIDRIAETVEQGSSLARQVIVPASARLAAVMAGVKAGLGALRRTPSHHAGNGVGARGELG